jgi:hypothetical protein
MRLSAPEKQHVSGAHQLGSRSSTEFDGSFKTLHGYFSRRTVLGYVLAGWEHESNDLQMV